MMSQEEKYDELIFAGAANSPEIFLPFYTIDFKKGCRKCRNGNIFDLDLSKKQLFISSPNNIRFLYTLKNINYRLVKEFKYPNGKMAYWNVEYFDGR